MTKKVESQSWLRTLIEILEAFLKVHVVFRALEPGISMWCPIKKAGQSVEKGTNASHLNTESRVPRLEKRKQLLENVKQTSLFIEKLSLIHI